MTKKEKLIDQFANYEGSRFFIECCADAFDKASIKENQIYWFVNNHFKQYDYCDIVQMKKCAAHWNNIQHDKLNQYDFLNFKHSLNTLSQYRMIIKMMEHETN